MAANASREKFSILRQTSVSLDELRMLIRLSKDLRFINIRQYSFAAEKLNEVGRLLSVFE